MVQSISTPVEEQIRQHLTDNLSTSLIGGYDPTQSDPTKSDFLPITTNWGRYGETYPIVLIQDSDTQVIGGGESGYTSVQGDGSGPNQRQQYNFQLQVPALTSESYRNSETAEQVTQTIYSGIHSYIQSNTVSPSGTDISHWSLSPGNKNEESDSGGTTFRVSRIGQLSVSVENEP